MDVNKLPQPTQQPTRPGFQLPAANGFTPEQMQRYYAGCLEPWLERQIRDVRHQLSETRR